MTTATSDDYDITFSNYPPILDQIGIGPAMSRRDPKSKRRIEPCTNDRGLALARFQAVQSQVSYEGPRGLCQNSPGVFGSGMRTDYQHSVPRRMLVAR